MLPVLRHHRGTGMRRSLTMFLLAMLAQPALAQSVIDSDFTIEVPTAKGDPIVESTTLVPLLTDTCYYWHLRFAKTKGDVTVTEIYTLPAPPANWDIGDSSLIVIADDQRSVTSELSLTPYDGWISSGWCISEGDPEGDYLFQIKSG